MDQEKIGDRMKKEFIVYLIDYKGKEHRVNIEASKFSEAYRMTESYGRVRNMSITNIVVVSDA